MSEQLCKCGHAWERHLDNCATCYREGLECLSFQPADSPDAERVGEGSLLNQLAKQLCPGCLHEHHRPGLCHHLTELSNGEHDPCDCEFTSVATANYTTNDDTFPTEVYFANGRTVGIAFDGDKPYLTVK